MPDRPLHRGFDGRAYRLSHTQSQDGSSLHREFVDAETGERVEAKQQVKGDETGTGDYIAFDPEEIAKAVSEADKTLDIEVFVPCDQVDDAYFDRNVTDLNRARSLQPVADIQSADWLAVPDQRGDGDFGRGAHWLPHVRTRAVYGMAYHNRRRSGSEGFSRTGNGAQGSIPPSPAPL